VFIKIFIVAAVVFGVMFAVKDGRIVRDVGLSASCSVVQGTADGARIEACRPGKLEGLPDLSRVGCTSAGIAGKLAYWSCPAPIEASQVGR